MTNITLIKASAKDHSVIQNMARFYVYDMARYCGWECPEDGLYECDDFKKYLSGPDKHAFIIRIDDELAGFVFINKLEPIPKVDYNMGEFFILAKFQNKGIGEQIAKQIFDRFPGEWSVGTIPDNKRALSFWRKVIAKYTNNNFFEIEKSGEELITADHPDPYPMIILRFKSPGSMPKYEVIVRIANLSDIISMTKLSDQKRTAYEKYQPQFWHKAEKANQVQKEWFKELLSFDNYILLVAEINKEIKGFLIGSLIKAPEVYDPGGLTLMIDDYCVADNHLWPNVGSKLLAKAKEMGLEKGANQVVIVTGHLDNPKNSFLKQQGLTIASNWYVGAINYN